MARRSRSAAPGYSLPGSLGQLLLAAAVAGLLVAGLLVPAVGALGLVAKNSADSFENLPSELSVTPPPQISRILAADGSTLASFYDQNRINVPLKQVAPVLRTAVIAIEDSRFYEHHGLDVRGTIRAAVTNLQTGSHQGGSTLTQQYVKNVFIENAKTAAERQAAVAVTPARKLREARYAIALEQQWSKDKILENYLNIAYFGGGAYGIGAAAKHYFNTTAAKLTLPQAALLAGIVRNPAAYDPALHPLASKARRNVVLARMAELDKITAYAASRAERSRVVLHLTRPRNGCIGTQAPFFCDYVVSEALRNPAFGKTPQDRDALLHRGGLIIRTSLDPKIQKAAQQAILKRTKVTDQVAAVADVVEPGTGLIRAMGVNRVYDNNAKAKGHTTVNLATGGQTGVQAGSTFKIFTLTAALEEGLSLNTQLQCPQRYVSSFPGSGGAPYAPSNAEPGGGTYNLFTATWASVNTCFVQLEERTGTERPAKLAESLGVRVVGGGALNRGGSFTLGGDSISPLAMAGAYAAFAAHGKYCPPSVLVSVTDSAGKPMPMTKPACKQVVERGIADTVTQVLRGVITSGTGRAASIGRPAAGKTGTATDYGAAWFDGYVPQLAAAVWMGDPRGAQRHPLRGVSIGGNSYGRVFGGTIAAPIWGDLMRRALKGQPEKSFAGLDPTVAAGQQVGVPSLTGLSVSTARARLAAVGLTGVVMSQRTNSSYPVGTVAGSSPGGGSSIGLGSSVLLYLSAGPAPTPSATPTPTTPSPSASPTPTPSKPPKPKPSKTPKPKPNKSRPPPPPPTGT